jgi:hypothetical protein
MDVSAPSLPLVPKRGPAAARRPAPPYPRLQRVTPADTNVPTPIAVFSIRLSNLQPSAASHPGPATRKSVLRPLTFDL